MNFGQALEWLKKGKAIYRSGWNGKGMWLKIYAPEVSASNPYGNGKDMTLPYIYIEYPVGHAAYPNGCRVPWLASQTDILANDWAYKA